jgi:hypothetical protein
MESPGVAARPGVTLISNPVAIEHVRRDGGCTASNRPGRGGSKQGHFRSAGACSAAGRGGRDPRCSQRFSTEESTPPASSRRPEPSTRNSFRNSWRIREPNRPSGWWNPATATCSPSRCGPVRMQWPSALQRMAQNGLQWPSASGYGFGRSPSCRYSGSTSPTNRRVDRPLCGDGSPGSRASARNVAPQRRRSMTRSSSTKGVPTASVPVSGSVTSTGARGSRSASGPLRRTCTVALWRVGVADVT